MNNLQKLLDDRRNIELEIAAEKQRIVQKYATKKKTISDRSKIFGKAVKKRRKQLNMTQSQLAIHSGVSRTTIANIETNRQDTSINTAFGLAEALDCTVNDFLYKPKNESDL